MDDAPIDEPVSHADLPTLGELIEGLSRPGAYAHPTGAIVVIQTHISVVFLAGDFVYKIKKPVDLGFLDFTTLDLRERFCHEEVRLNRRLAPGVYLGVCAIVREEGRLVVQGETMPAAPGDSASVTGDRAPVEWAVRMRRLPEDRTMARWVDEGALRPYHVAVVARRLARFHAQAERGPDVSRWGRFEVVSGNARENLAQSVPHIGQTLTDVLHARLSDALERELASFSTRIEDRARADVPRDTHGDLHLSHVYLFGDREPPEDVIIVDCIEFNERFRFADPVADVAFLVMDLVYHDRSDLARQFAEAYFEAAEDNDGRDLLLFYAAYRAAVRAKVEGMRALEPEVPVPDREKARSAAQAHWLLALRLLERPRGRPCLVLIGGLPGTGKTTLAATLGERAGFEVISSDPTRKRLAGMDAETSAATEFGEGIYTTRWNDRTYETLFREAEAKLMDGGRVIVDASFREDDRRAEFLGLAERLCVPCLFLRLEAPDERVRLRIASREAGASDADVATYDAVRARWEPSSPETRDRTKVVDTAQSPEWSVEQSLVHLERVGVFGGG